VFVFDLVTTILKKIKERRLRDFYREEIKKTKTEEISKSLNLSMNKITDIARFETNKQSNETIRKNLDFLSQPTKAETPTERQKFMNIRTELFNRTIKEDRMAKQILSSISSSHIEQTTRREELLRTVPQTSSLTQVVSYKANVSQDKISSVNNSFFSSVAANSSLVNTVSKNTNVSSPQIQSVISSLNQNVQNVAQATKSINTVSAYSPSISSSQSVNSSFVSSVASNSNMVNTIAKNTSASSSQVQTVLASYKNSISASAPSTTSSSSFKTQTINQIYQATGISREKVESVIKEVDRVANTPILNQQVATPAEIITNVCKETGIEKTKVITVIKEVAKVAVADKDTIKKIAEKENLKEEQVKKIISTQTPLVTEPEKHIEQTLSIPPSVSIEDYEEVKKMWTSQYEKGEVPAGITAVAQNIADPDIAVADDGADICSLLVPQYIAALPTDPTIGDEEAVSVPKRQDK